jgi:FkbM family methyltransferase
MKRYLEHLQVGLNMIGSRFPASQKKPVYLKQVGDVFEVHVEGHVLLAPGIRRWRMYRRGIEARLEAVARRYGLHDVSPRSEGDWVVDIGGYMGEWSLYMLRKGFNVLAIEPDPNAARCLKENLTRYAPKGRIWLHDPRVAFNERKTVTFYSEPGNADGSVFPSVKHKSTPILLETERLDAIVADRIGDQPIRVFKMDAEGAEPEVLMGAPKVLTTCQRVGIDAGAERMGEATVDDCRRILLEAGFKFLPSHERSAMVVVAEKKPAD